MSGGVGEEQRYLDHDRIEDYRLVRTIPTRWDDNDHYGHVNNIQYYAFVDTVVNRHLMTEGRLDLDTSEEIGLVVESSCRYRRSLAYPEDVQVGISVARVGRSSVTYKAAVADAQGRIAADLHFVHVYVVRATSETIPVPDRILTAVAPLRLDLPG